MFDIFLKSFMWEWYGGGIGVCICRDWDRYMEVGECFMNQVGEYYPLKADVGLVIINS